MNAEKCVRGNESNVPEFAAGNTEGNKLPMFVDFTVSRCVVYLLQNCDANLAILNSHYLKVFLDILESR